MGARQTVPSSETFDNHSRINFVSPTVTEEEPDTMKTVTEEEPEIMKTPSVDPQVLEELKIGARVSEPRPLLRGRHRHSLAVLRPRHPQTEQANVFSIKRKRRRGSLVSGT